MTPNRRRRVSEARGPGARLLGWAALALALVAALGALPSAASAATMKPAGAAGQLGPPPPAGATPNQVIDAQTNPQNAGDTLDNDCSANMQKCSWVPDIPPKSQPAIPVDWGPPRILGDVLYNCSPTNYAETAVDIGDEREESTSISESLTLELELGFLGFEETTAEFEAFSKQSETFSTSVTTTNAVAVPPMWKGYTTTSVLSGVITGSAYVTEGINNLIQVKDIDMSFPGYAGPGHPGADGGGVHRQPLADERGRDPVALQRRQRPRRHQARSTPPRRGGSRSRICTKHGRCRTRTATGAQLPDFRRAGVKLRRHGHTYATGTVRGRKIRLTAKRPVKPGTYTLAIGQHAKPTGLGHRPLRALQTNVPITLR